MTTPTDPLALAIALAIHERIDAAVDRAVAGLDQTIRPRAVTPRHAGQLLDISETSVRALVKAGDLEAVTILNAMRIPLDAIDAYLRRQRLAATPPPAIRPSGRSRRVTRLA